MCRLNKIDDKNYKNLIRLHQINNEIILLSEFIYNDFDVSSNVNNEMLNFCEFTYESSIEMPRQIEHEIKYIELKNELKNMN